MSYSVNLQRNEPHRIKFQAEIYDKRTADMKPIHVMVDTGCYNSLIPLNRARVSGVPLHMERAIVIGAVAIKTEAYVIDAMRIGEKEIKSVFMLAAAFKGELADTILMGLNILNNWKYMIHRRDNVLTFEESYPDALPNTVHPYRNFFDKDGKYVLLQDKPTCTPLKP